MYAYSYFFSNPAHQLHAYMYTHTPTYIHTNAYVRTHFIRRVPMLVYMYVCMHICICIYIYTYPFASMSTKPPTSISIIHLFT